LRRTVCVFTFNESVAIIGQVYGQTYPENHWNKEVYQGIAVSNEAVVKDEVDRSTDHGHFVICCLRVSGCSSVTRLGLFLSSFSVVSIRRTPDKNSRTSWDGRGNTKGRIERNGLTL
jgi:hypothetical protein